MPDYSKGKIYTIRNRNDNTLIYVGSTIQSLAVRWGAHKRYSKIKGDRLIYSTINNNWTDWYIELYANYPCENKEQLCKREGEVIREIATLNIYIAGRTQKEYRTDNKDKINEKKKQYRTDNKDKINEHNKEYYIDNTEKIKDKVKQYRIDNAEKIKQYQKQYHQRKKLEKANIQ